MKRILLSRPIGILLFVAAFVGMSSALVSATARTSTSPQAKPAVLSPGLPNDKTLGSKNAPITIEVFSDFECPACRSFYEMTMKQVMDNYVNAGKVYVVYRDFPLDIHPYSRQAARLANAAAEVGQFETIERALFDKQDDWAPTGKIEDAVAMFFSPADWKKIRDFEMQHINEINVLIDHDRMMGIERNVNQTPTIYVTAHGKTEALPGGGVSYPLMKQYLDYLLRQ